NPTNESGSSSGLVVRLVAVALVGVLAVALAARRRLLVALSALTASPAQKRAAGVRAFLPSPAPGGPAARGASTVGAAAAPVPTLITVAEEARRGSSRAVPNET